MTSKFRRYELPMAYSMITTARKIRSRRDGGHLFEKYFLFWTAFNYIYTTLAHKRGHKTQLVEKDDGTIVTIQNGNVKIPQVKTISEREQIYLALDDFDEILKQNLILHESIRFFINRIPLWQGKRIEFDAFGQRVNGVINVNHTSNPDYPIWSPIDIHYYEEYIDDPDDQELRDFLSKQVVDLLYTVRMNLMHGSKKLDDANDLTVVENALPMIELIDSSFIQ